MQIVTKRKSTLVENEKQQAKLKHVNACLLPASQYKKSAGFENIELVHQSAAGLSFNDIRTAVTFLGHELKAPLMIAPMTGGTERGAILNQRWARASEYFGLPFGVGSQRLALFDQHVEQSFMVRKYAQNTMIFANLGAAQLIKDGENLCLRAIKMIDANALFIHLNPLQEACQEGGDTNWNGVLKAIGRVVEALHKQSIPVLVREVGFGLSEQAARSLISTGIMGIDCAGAGGTSWAKVEALCATSDQYRRLGETFGEWGIPTVQSIANVRKIDKNIPLIATGGIRTGLDIAKSLALGANLAAMAQPMLSAAILGEHELFTFIEQILLELRVAMLATGASTIADLKVAFRP